jgi:type IV secretory pathway VirB2 component (pilin)
VIDCTHRSKPSTLPHASPATSRASATSASNEVFATVFVEVALPVARCFAVAVGVLAGAAWAHGHLIKLSHDLSHYSVLFLARKLVRNISG